jgi:hypothetical protein
MDDTLSYVEALTEDFNTSAVAAKDRFAADRQILVDNYDKAKETLINFGSNTVNTAFSDFIKKQCKDEAILELDVVKGSIGDW